VISRLPNKSADIFNKKCKCRFIIFYLFPNCFQNSFQNKTQKISALLYTLIFEKTALLAKLTFQPSLMFKNSGSWFPRFLLPKTADYQIAVTGLSWQISLLRYSNNRVLEIEPQTQRVVTFKFFNGVKTSRRLELIQILINSSFGIVDRFFLQPHI
jgi:hypothetical protein